MDSNGIYKNYSFFKYFFQSAIFLRKERFLSPSPHSKLELKWDSAPFAITELTSQLSPVQLTELYSQLSVQKSEQKFIFLRLFIFNSIY